MTPVGFSERPFDASILGRPVWCLDDVAQAKNAVTDAQRESIGLMFRRGDASEGGILEPLGFRKIETLITLGCALPGQKQRLPTGIGIAQATDADAIAVTAGTVILKFQMIARMPIRRPGPIMMFWAVRVSRWLP